MTLKTSWATWSTRLAEVARESWAPWTTFRPAEGGPLNAPRFSAGAAAGARALGVTLWVPAVWAPYSCKVFAEPAATEWWWALAAPWTVNALGALDVRLGAGTTAGVLALPALDALDATPAWGVT